MAGTGPLRKPSAFFVSINKSFHNFALDIGIHEGKKREYRPERIPETVIGVHITRKDFSVIRTIMYNLILCIYLEKLAGKKQHPVKKGIKCSLLIRCSSFNIYPSQLFIPGCFPFIFNCLKVFCACFTSQV